MDEFKSCSTHSSMETTVVSGYVGAMLPADVSFRHRWMQDTGMADATNYLLPMLESLRDDYDDIGERTCELLRMLGSDTVAFEREQAAALAHSGVGGIIDRARAGEGAVSEQEIRRFATAHYRENVERACVVISQQGVDIDKPERVWRNGIRCAGAGELLGISGPARSGEHDWSRQP